MYEQHLTCNSCQSEFPLDQYYHCPKCNGVLVVSYGPKYYDRLKEVISHAHKYLDFLPVKAEHYLDLGQGNTPLVQSKRREHLFFKAEFLNPTGSFKDRPVSVGVSLARSKGKKVVVIASSGNGAASASAYAACANIRCLVFVPESTVLEKVMQAQYYGADIIKVPGPYSNSFSLAKQVADEFAIPNITTTFLNPYTVEGDVLVAYEIFRQLDGVVPNSIHVPIGAGPLLAGIHRGFQALFKAGVTERQPQMVGVQASGCSPIYKAFKADNPVQACKSPITVAGGIADGLSGYTQDGQYVLDLIRASDGWCIAISDDDILATQQQLAIEEGLFVEPSSAAAFASVLKQERKESEIGEYINVAILTGTGFKDMNALQGTSTKAPVVASTLKEAATALSLN